jgi:hypothetical protein
LDGGDGAEGDMGRPRERRTHLRAVGVVLVAVLLAAACGGSSSSKKAKAPKKEVFTEPISTANNPFTPPTGSDFQNIPPVQTQGGVSTQSGGQVGLFGGTMNESSCNKEQLITFLEQNRDKGQAWASALGINFADIRAYVGGLTPALLRSDTRVTNHGWKNGKLTAIQVVLQAGHAVLLDDKGFPVVKCYCGNPLTAPEEYPPVYYGPKWNNFNKDSLTVINKEPKVIDVYVLFDPRTGETFLRPRGTSGEADTPSTPPPTTAPPTTRYTPPTTRYTPPTTHPPTTPPTTQSTTTTMHTPSST